MRPKIGITADYQMEDNDYTLRDYYVSAVHAAGGVALIIPPADELGLLEDYIGYCHGFILSGGGDIDPFYWGELPGNEQGEINPRRDTFELALARTLIERDVPLMGICRGCQVINVAAGGSLYQHITGSLAHCQKAPRNYPFHDILIASGSILANLFAAENIRVNSFHHQAVKQAGQNLIISAQALDGTVEAVEGSLNLFLLGVQWHPECLADEYSARLFQALVDAARRYMHR
ncbi:gamma-glutamyl-gamma-aminobutyrate hydrolase family protein [Syntrophomonas palmitatica]|uniref:gamma-glutamyl-gamma-aminobutyrate hydrolase family protein n=1 Tax=Syntrophomonas palmitatica TaxID=402877 RepID=UPI0006D2786F|nr:gamma-glutamyl-gamma-aminobutyrate hydrolase family protein [Syntrophomonas palmitatica]